MKKLSKKDAALLEENLKNFSKNTDTVNVCFEYKGQKGEIGGYELETDEFHGNTLTELGIKNVTDYYVQSWRSIESMKKKKNQSKLKRKHLKLVNYTIKHKHLFN